MQPARRRPRRQPRPLVHRHPAAGHDDAARPAHPPRCRRAAVGPAELGADGAVDLALERCDRVVVVVGVVVVVVVVMVGGNGAAGGGGGGGRRRPGADGRKVISGDLEGSLGRS